MTTQAETHNHLTQALLKIHRVRQDVEALNNPALLPLVAASYNALHAVRTILENQPRLYLDIFTLDPMLMDEHPVRVYVSTFPEPGNQQAKRIGEAFIDGAGDADASYPIGKWERRVYEMSMTTGILRELTDQYEARELDV